MHSFDNDLCLGMYSVLVDKQEKVMVHNLWAHMIYRISYVIKLLSDNRLGVQILDLSQNLHFKYRTFRFQQIKTIDQRNRISKSKKILKIYYRGYYINRGKIKG